MEERLREDMSQTIWIARHGNRLDFVDLDWFTSAERPYDPPLSEDGVLQAQELGKRLKSESIGHIFASPFLRTVQTVHEVAKILDLPIKLEAGLSEWLNPDWMPQMPEKLDREILATRYPPIDLDYTSAIVPEYPESKAMVMQRTAETARCLVEKYAEDILLVGHGASVLGTSAGLLQDNPTINATFCCLVKLVKLENSWKMELNGDTTHLSQTETQIRFN